MTFWTISGIIMADETKNPVDAGKETNKNPYEDFINDLLKIDRHIRGIIDSLKNLGKKGNDVTKNIENKIK